MLGGGSCPPPLHLKEKGDERNGDKAYVGKEKAWSDTV